MFRRSGKSAATPLEKDGPIVTRARASLQRVAAEFGKIKAKNNSQVTVLTEDGITLRLSYEYGNYLFSRVYNLAISVDLPQDTPIPAGLRLSHRGGGRPTFRSVSGTGTSTAERLVERVGDDLARIDLANAQTRAHQNGVRMTLTPLGGAFVWVLLPPVFKTIAFPAGEIDRINHVLSVATTFSATSNSV